MSHFLKKKGYCCSSIEANETTGWEGVQPGEVAGSGWAASEQHTGGPQVVPTGSGRLLTYSVPLALLIRVLTFL